MFVDGYEKVNPYIVFGAVAGGAYLGKRTQILCGRVSGGGCPG